MSIITSRNVNGTTSSIVLRISSANGVSSSSTCVVRGGFGNCSSSPVSFIILHCSSSGISSGWSEAAFSAFFAFLRAMDADEARIRRGLAGVVSQSTERKQSPRDSLIAMSDADDHQRLLQILETHGQNFLSSFEQPSKPSSSKRKLEESDPSSDNDGEDEEWYGFGTGSMSSDASEGGDLTGSFHGALRFLRPRLKSPYERRVQ